MYDNISMSQTKSPCSVLVPGSSWNSKKKERYATNNYASQYLTTRKLKQAKQTNRTSKQTKQKTKTKQTNKQKYQPTNSLTH